MTPTGSWPRLPPAGAAARRWGWAVLLAALVLGPNLTARGYALAGDMVFVPRQPWKPAWLGLDGGVPRAVPSDALTWLATQVLPGDLVQKAVLLGLLAAAGAGAARLVGAHRFLPGAAAATLYVWNPFVHERLAIGHWALLCGYAALPWAVLAARRLAVGGGSGRGLAALTVPLALAAFTSPTGGVLVAGCAVAVLAAAARPRVTLAAAAAAAVVNLPWLLPGVLGVGDQLAADPSGVTAFAARADTPWGVLGSLLSFGGIWKESVHPATRDVLVLSGLALVVTAVGAAAYLRGGADRGPGRRADRALAVVALGGLLLAWWPSTGPGAEAVSWLVGEVPGAGLLRDSQKWVAPLVLVVAVGLGRAGEAMLGRRDDVHARSWAAAACLLPVLLQPGTAWGLLGHLAPVDYPADWFAARAALEEAGAGAGRERVLVLPFQVYRRYDWNDDRAVLDPAPRFFPGRTVTEDALPVEGGVVGGESRAAREVRDSLGTPSAVRVLRDQGVRWVLVQRTVPGAEQAEGAVPAGAVVHRGPEIEVLDLGAVPSGGADRLEGWAPAVAVLDAAALLVWLLAVGVAVSPPRSPRHAYTQPQQSTEAKEHP